MSTQEFYDNGMVKLASRIEDEFWYNDYLTVVHLISENTFNTLGDFIRASHKTIESYRSIPEKMSISIVRWCVLLWERQKHYR